METLLSRGNAGENPISVRILIFFPPANMVSLNQEN
ncbi:MAG: hypothetical protein CM1200mP36_10450 [Gammaproteobacteria bacterium]|nr:MAG: hypothetical protein CM1200mP36_10450 [Gammaproteobacteria bacterium]